MSNSIAVIGGGLAGLAAAEAACRFGLRVELFEQAASLGGRAGSFVEPYNDRLVDFGRHAAMGCCTNFLDFCRRTGAADCFRREKTLHFLGPDNRVRRFAPSRWLPAPFHLIPELKKLDFISPNDRRDIVGAIKQLAKDDSPSTFGDWLRKQNQSKQAVELFWSVIIQSALGETVDHVTFSAARKVFVEGFLASRTAGDMILSSVPLAEIFDERVAHRLIECGATIHRRRRAMWIESDDNGQLSLVAADGDVREFDRIVLAVPWHQAAGLFPPMLLEELPELSAVQNLVPGAIAAVHLWFDRPITRLPHAIFTGKLSQWIFDSPSQAETGCHAHACRGHEGNSVQTPQAHGKRGHGVERPNDIPATYYQVIVSAAHRLTADAKDALLDRVLEELAEAFPETRSARLLHSRVVVQPQAVFSMQPGADKYRPSQTASLPNLFLAGDWTETGWPATMEGAVRSGYLAVESLLRSLGRSEKILVPDLPHGFWARKILGV
ncbi:MAG: FAD-dependent oxidoreductase [Pirellulales bacterium]|nr:FAD-dependent oxidoreductase [Pirellulales bacterium]